MNNFTMGDGHVSNYWKRGWHQILLTSTVRHVSHTLPFVYIYKPPFLWDLQVQQLLLKSSILFPRKVSRKCRNIHNKHYIEEQAEMGRAPCCDKNGLKKGPWTQEEDAKLMQFIQTNGPGNWRTLPQNAGVYLLYISSKYNF